MGVASSKIDEDRALQLCHARKKCVREALDGRCALAATHVAYFRSLKLTGTELRKFLQPEVPLESSLYTSTTATPEPLALTHKSVSHFSFSSPSVSRSANPNDHHSPSLSPSPPMSSRYQVYHMKFRGSFTKKVEEKPPEVLYATVTSLSSAQDTMPHSDERTEPILAETPTHQPETPPWDYFGVFHPIDNHFSSGEQRDVFHGYGSSVHLKHLREEDEIPKLENEDDDNMSCYDSKGSESDDGFDDPPSDTLVRSFKNLTREESHVAADASPTLPTMGSSTSVNSLLDEDRVNSPKLSPLKTKPLEPSISIETKVTPAKEDSTEHMSTDAKATPVEEDSTDHRNIEAKVRPVKQESIKHMSTHAKVPPVKGDSIKHKSTDAKVEPLEEDSIEDKIAPKDFLSSMRDVENLFIKASESGKEVPRMLEANKLHFRPLVNGQESGASTASILLKACFSCGEDPNQVQEDPAQTSIKYLTWHRTMSFRSSSSRNLIGVTRDDAEDFTSDLLESSSKASASHASTLDRLYAWEKKLYDEVKASQAVRRHYDMKCKFLRDQETRCESQSKIDKTRAVVKDLHTRIRVAIHRIDSISRRIEDLRDKELQPQLEELIEGLWRMWDTMCECHKSQVHIITIAYSNSNTKLSIQSDPHGAAAQLESDLSNLASSFSKWINALKTYIQAINDWLQKCVCLPEKSSKKRRWGLSRQQQLRNAGPPIYTTCGGWLESLEKLPVKEAIDTVKGLAAEVSRFLPRQDKRHGRKTTVGGSDPELEMLTTHQAFEEWRNTGCDQFRSSLVIFLSQMAGFAESSVKMYAELHTNIQDAKRNYEHKMSQP